MAVGKFEIWGGENMFKNSSPTFLNDFFLSIYSFRALTQPLVDCHWL